jgi:hypothetical protein
MDEPGLPTNATLAGSGPAAEEEVSPERAAAMKHQIATLQYHLHLLEQTVQQLRQEAVTASAATGPTGKANGKAGGRSAVRSEGRKRATPPAPRNAPRWASETCYARLDQSLCMKESVLMKCMAWLVGVTGPPLVPFQPVAQLCLTSRPCPERRQQ